MNPEPKRMPIREFRQLGYLQEVNRQFLHPLGLALEVVVEDCHCANGTVETGPPDAMVTMVCPDCDGSKTIERLGGVWDYRDDPEGIFFGEGAMSAEKADRIAGELVARTPVREKLLGFSIQPVEVIPGEKKDEPQS